MSAVRLLLSINTSLIADYLGNLLNEAVFAINGYHDLTDLT